MIRCPISNTASANMNPELAELFKQRAIKAESTLRFLRDAMDYDWCTKEFIKGHIRKANADTEKLITQYESAHPDEE